MRIRTSKDLAPALYGSAFRRVTCDGRTWFVRKIRTLGDLFRGRRPVSLPAAIERVRTGRNMS
jgi:hypothetical protein